MSNNLLSTIPNNWVYTRGANSNVFVIDSGLDTKNKYIAKNVIQYKEFAHPYFEHGTHVCGIICSNASNIYSVNGFASLCNLYFGAISLGSSIDYSNLKKALNWILELDVIPDVLNLSLAYNDDNIEIRNLLYMISECGCLICCAYSDVLPYPHSYDFTISVNNTFNDNCDIVTPGIFISTVENNHFKKLAGNSMSTAFVSSVASLAKSFDNTINKELFINRIVGSKFVDLNINRNTINVDRQINLGE